MNNVESDIPVEELGKFGHLLSKVCTGFIIFMAILFTLTIIIYVITHPGFFDHIASYLLSITIVFLFSTFLYGNIKSISECDLIGGAYLFFMGAIFLDTIFIPLLLNDFSIALLLFVIGINFLMLFWGVMGSIILHRDYKNDLEENIE